MTIQTLNPALASKSPLLGSSILPQWGLILVDGPDAAGLLQSQLSNSILNLKLTAPGGIAQGFDAVKLVGYCNPKGRLLASAWVAEFANEDGSKRFALYLSRDIAAAAAKKLSMYILRSKVKVIDASDEWVVSGIYGTVEEINHCHIDNASLALRLPDIQIESQLYGRVLRAQQISRDTENIAQEDIAQWNSFEVLSAIPRITLATQEQFVPQMINFESVLGVDFKKGCYPGQEIVARSQYRGAVKRRLQLAHLFSDHMSGDQYAPGTEIFSSNDPTQPAGMVVLAAPNPLHQNRIDFQIECKLEALEKDEIRLGSFAGPVLKIDLLPYPLLEI
jgi:folate-binding protein YgfZ